MYEELVEALRLCVKYGKAEDALANAQKAADAIEKLTEVIQNHDFLESLVKPRWIPVTERLPKGEINPNTHDFEYVLCTTIWGDVRPFKYGKPIGRKEAHFWNGAGYVDAYITHWQPLPEPPKHEVSA